MKSILIIVLLLLVSIAGCFAQEKGMFLCDAMTFDSTSQIQGKLVLEVSRYKNEAWVQGQTFYLTNNPRIIGRDCILEGRATNYDKINLFYTKGLLVGGVITKRVFVPRTGRYRNIIKEFTRKKPNAQIHSKN